MCASFGGDVEVELKTFSSETDSLLTLYEYDVFDRLIKIEQGEGIIENAYTADGKKFSRTTNGEVTYYVYDGNVIFEEQNFENKKIGHPPDFFMPLLLHSYLLLLTFANSPSLQSFLRREHTRHYRIPPPDRELPPFAACQIQA